MRARVQDITRKNFPLPRLGARLAAIGDAAFRGCGFQLVRPVCAPQCSLKPSASSSASLPEFFMHFQPINCVQALPGLNQWCHCCSLQSEQHTHDFKTDSDNTLGRVHHD